MASGKKIIGHAKIAEEAARFDRKIADYLGGLDEADATEPDDRPDAVPAALTALQARRGELDRLAAKLDAEGRATIVEGEEDARPMGRGNGPKPPCYNVQTAVDADTGLIVHHEVTDEPSDNRLLHPMSVATKQVLGQERLTVVADAGYSSGAHASACERDGIVACAPANRAVNNQADGKLFDRSAFTYEPDTDSYRCAAGRVLVRKQLHRRKRNVAYISSMLWLRSQAAMHHCRAPIIKRHWTRTHLPDECRATAELWRDDDALPSILRHHQADDGRRKV